MAVVPEAPRGPARRWVVRSVVLRARDGPHRLAQAYRLLLVESAVPPVPPAAPGGDPLAARDTRDRDKERPNGNVPTTAATGAPGAGNRRA